MPYTQPRTVPWNEMTGADGEKIYGFGGAQREYFNVTGVAGTTYKACAVVPAGQFWMLQTAFARCDARALTRILIYIYDGTHGYTLAAIFNPLQYQPVVFNGNAPMIAGDCVYFAWAGTQIGDTLPCSYIATVQTTP